jgi:hypothetical protein
MKWRDPGKKFTSRRIYSFRRLRAEFGARGADVAESAALVRV